MSCDADSSEENPDIATISKSSSDGEQLERSQLHPVCKRKSYEAIMQEAAADQHDGGIKLGLFDLLCIGIGSTIGSGVFVLTGSVLPVAGPSAIVGWFVAGLACLLSGFSYMELSSRLPTKGSCYVFAYHALGELAAIVGAVCLTLEYGISGAGLARSWSEKFVSMVGAQAKQFVFIHLKEQRNHDAFYSAQSEAVRPDLDNYYFDVGGAAVMLLIVFVTMIGLSLGKIVINTLTVSKVLLVVFMCATAFSQWSINIVESWQTFAPQGTRGIVKASTLVFFGFIGFDEVCCLASKSNEPSKTMPRAIAGTLFGATIVSFLAQLSLAGFVPYNSADTPSFESAFAQNGLVWAQYMTGIGELILLPLTIFLSFLPQPELMAAMAEDKLLPSVFCQKSADGNYMAGAAITGIFMILISFAVPFSILWDVISLGVLLGFNLTNASIIQVRYGNGGFSTNPAVSQMVWSLLGSSVVGGYGFWQGFVDPSLKGEPIHQLASAFGLIGLLVTLALSISIFCSHSQGIDDPSVEIYKMHGVPFVPSVAMVLNAILASEIDWVSHGFFLILLLSFLCVYFAYKFSKQKLKKGQTKPGFTTLPRL